ALDPSLEGQPLVLGQRPPPVDSDESLHQEAEQRVAISEIRQRGGQAAKSSQEPRMPEQPVAQRPSFFARALVLGAPDVFLNADLRWAGDLTELAPGAEVESGSDG